MVQLTDWSVGSMVVAAAAGSVAGFWVCSRSSLKHVGQQADSGRSQAGAQASAEASDLLRGLELR